MSALSLSESAAVSDGPVSAPVHPGNTHTYADDFISINPGRRRRGEQVQKEV